MTLRLGFFRNFIFVSMFISSSSMAQWQPLLGPSGRNPVLETTDGMHLYVRTDAGQYFSSDQGLSWFPVDTVALPNQQYALTVSDSTLYALGAGRDNLFRYEKEGMRWTNISIPISLLGGVRAVHSVFDTTGRHPLAIFVATAGSGVFRSSDSGRHWTPTNSGLTKAEGYIWCLASIETTLFAGTSVGVFRSNDYGNSWILGDSITAAPYANSLLAGGPITAGAVPTLYAGGFGVYSTDDLGQHWTDISAGLPPGVGGTQPWTYIQSLAQTGANLFAATLHGGVFLLRKNGALWQNVSSGIADTAVYSLVICDGRIFAESTGSLWQRPLSELITSIREQDFGQMPGDFVMRQNYPNPFNPVTTIPFHTTMHSLVKLAVYNILGERIAVLIQGELDAGDHKAQFDGSRLPSGVYFARLQASEGAQVRKLVLSK